MKHGRRTDRFRQQWVFACLWSIPGILLALGISSCADLGSPEKDIPVTSATDQVIEIAVGDIPGFPTSLRIEDSLGHPAATVRVGGPLWLRYTALNQTGKSQFWSTAMSYPFAHFYIKRGTDTLFDSFSGLAFAAVVVRGVVVNGDSLTASWRLDPVKHPLTPGTYTAVAVPMYVIGDAKLPDTETALFSVVR